MLLVFDEAFWERAEGKRDFWGITARSARERGVAFQFWNMQRCTGRPAHSTRLTPALNLALSLALALALARALALTLALAMSPRAGRCSSRCTRALTLTLTLALLLLLLLTTTTCY